MPSITRFDKSVFYRSLLGCMELDDVLHNSSVRKVDIFLCHTVGMNTADSILVFGTVPYPLGRAFSNRL